MVGPGGARRRGESQMRLMERVSRKTSLQWVCQAAKAVMSGAIINEYIDVDWW